MGNDKLNLAIVSRATVRSFTIAMTVVAAMVVAAILVSADGDEPAHLAASAAPPPPAAATVTAETSTSTSSPPVVVTTAPRRSSPPSASRPPAPRAMRAAAPYSSGGVAKAVWDIPGSGFNRGDAVVALTFDDGPDRRWTPQILDVLGRYGVHATFFSVGRMASAHPDLIRAQAAAGHGVANHTWNHVDLRRTSNYAHEVDDTSRLLADLSGRAIGCIRPPEGLIDAATTAKLRQRGLTAVMWDVDARDFTRPPADTIVNRVLSAVRPGSIILLHDGGGDRSQTLAALPRIIEGIQARGLKMVVPCGAPAPPPTTTTTSPPPPPETTTTTTLPPEPTTTTTEAPPETTTTSTPPAETTTTQGG